MMSRARKSSHVIKVVLLSPTNLIARQGEVIEQLSRSERRDFEYLDRKGCGRLGRAFLGGTDSSERCRESHEDRVVIRTRHGQRSSIKGNGHVHGDVSRPRLNELRPQVPRHGLLEANRRLLRRAASEDGIQDED